MVTRIQPNCSGWSINYLFFDIDVISIASLNHRHASGYGLFSANTLGHLVFSKGTHELNFHLTRGKSAEFKYRLVVATGDLSDDAINQLADDYSSAVE